MINHLINIPSQETPPKAGAIINVFKDFGNILKIVVADIIDNSISANARTICTEYEWNY